MKNIITVPFCLMAMTGLDAYAQGVSEVASNLAQEKQLGIAVFLALDHDDNITKQDTNKVSDIREVVGANVNYAYTSRVLDLGLDYELTHEEYEDSTFQSKSRLQGGGRAQVSTNPARYSWLFQHDQSIANSNSRNADTPDNLIQRSVFTTGPNLNLRISPVDSLSGSLRFIDVRFDEQGDNDTKHNKAQINWSHQLNTRNNIGIVTSYVEVKGDALNSDYKQEKVGLLYGSKQKYSTYALEAGVTSVKRDLSGADDVDGEYFRVNFNSGWEGNEIGVSFDRDITDTSIGLSQNFEVDSGFDSGDTNFDAFDIITRSRYQFYYNRRNADGRVGASLLLNHDEEKYETLINDKKTYKIAVSVDYAIAQNLVFTSSYLYEIHDYIDEPLLGEDDKTQVSIKLDHSISDTWSFGYSLHYFERANSETSLRDFKSIRALFRVNYQIR